MNRALYLPLLAAAFHGMTAAPALPPNGSLQHCKAPEAARIHLRSRDARAAESGIHARLSGTSRFALELRDEQTGAVLWTAGATPGALLEIPAMDQPVLARPRPVDLDGDGFHDRVYLADMGGRLWRLDIDAGAPHDRPIAVSLLADLSGGGMRGFLAAPDVALQAFGNQSSWLSLAIGSVSHAGQPAVNRFYVLRDDAGGTGPDSGSARRVPLRDEDLRLSEGVAGSGDIDNLARDERSDGFYVSLGAAQVLAPSLTIHGVVVFTSATLAFPEAGGCASLSTPSRALIEVRAVSAVNGRPALDLNDDDLIDRHDAVFALSDAQPPDSAVRIVTPDESDNSAIRPCRVDDQTIPGCEVDTGLRRRYWLREDAD